jgi:uncharacterized damage-inducible protein DinB
MTRRFNPIAEAAVPKAADPSQQYLLNTYASEINKLLSVWSEFDDADLVFRPHPRSTVVGDILKHELLSARRFCGEFLGLAEPPATEVPPAEATVAAYLSRARALALPRLDQLSKKPPAWWQEKVPFFDVQRERIWVFWRRVLHTAHHRTQLTVYLRLLDKPVPAIYGPSADTTWSGADPTLTVESAERK